MMRAVLLSGEPSRVVVAPWPGQARDHGRVGSELKQVLLAAHRAVCRNPPIDLPVPVLSADLDPALQIEHRQEDCGPAAATFPAMKRRLRLRVPQRGGHFDFSLVLGNAGREHAFCSSSPDSRAD